MCLRSSEKKQPQMDEGLFGWTPDEKKLLLEGGQGGAQLF